MRHFIVLVLVLSFAGSTTLAQHTPAQPPASVAAPSAPATPASGGASVANEADPFMDLPPLPKGDISLVGGKVLGVDRVRNRLTVEAFGGKKVKFSFDERTHIYRDGVETTQLGIHKGDCVYVDTQLAGPAVFARNIRVGTKPGSAYAQGQIESYDPSREIVVLRDSLSSEPITFRVTPTTAVKGKATSASELRQGALVSVKFAPESGNKGIAQEITVTARPGESIVFAGRVTFLDMRSGVLGVLNQTDNKTYDVRFAPAIGGFDNLGVGADVNVTAQFDGTGYVARQITVTQAKESPNK